MALHPFDAPALNLTQDSTSKGLYQILVTDHLNMYFLQHFSATSYAIISNLANAPVSPSFDSNSHRFMHCGATYEVDTTAGAQIFLLIKSVGSRPVVGRSILYLSHPIGDSETCRNNTKTLCFKI